MSNTPNLPKITGRTLRTGLGRVNITHFARDFGIPIRTLFRIKTPAGKPNAETVAAVTRGLIAREVIDINGKLTSTKRG